LLFHGTADALIEDVLSRKGQSFPGSGEPAGAV